MKRAAGIVLPLVLVGGLTAACGGGDDGPTATGTPGSPVAPEPSGSAPASSGGTAGGTAAPSRPATPQAAGEDRCHTSMLSASLVPTEPSAGHRYAYLTLTNRSGQKCHLYGYVGMRLIGKDGTPLTATVTRLAPAPHRVELPPGAGARTRVQWGVVPSGGEPETGPCEPTPGRVEVTPPDERDHLTVAWSLGVVCNGGKLSVTPVGGA
ncbi:DUF4232 domain-containing protein [Actinomadura atramentaria]|uniref:DUF4232 domain-containing protein n=1 Tax=Actinomadura atramentaria TaxID=1990 RepID=UPI0003602827|nr:DUF4232 domain-containing protein [Actinomadura atramentaria]